MKILFFSVEWIGHVNPCIALAHLLKERGHHIIFLAQKSIKNLVTKHKIETILLEEPEMTEEAAALVKEKTLRYFKDKCASFRLSPAERVAMMKPVEWENLIQFVEKYDHQITDHIKSLQPDLIVYSTLVSMPSINLGKTPWVFLQPMNPLLIYEDQGAPPWSAGFAMDGDKEEWSKFREVWLEADTRMSIDFYGWFKERGIDIPRGKMFQPSPYLNVYFYPEDLDYSEFGKPPENWVRIDALVRPDDGDPIDLDQEFLSAPGKLIYFSLGTIASFDIPLMQSMISILSKSPNKFVVSKGPLGDQIKLADNMRGLHYVNQIRLLPMVDLAIVHGGNNSLVEALYFGKPMIIMPTAVDQYDNARRIQEKKLGLWLPTFEVTEEKLLVAIDQLLTDVDLKMRLKSLSEKLQSSKSGQEAISKIEALVQEE